jgi:hypothetical protein
MERHNKANTKALNKKTSLKLETSQLSLVHESSLATKIVSRLLVSKSARLASSGIK